MVVEIELCPRKVFIEYKSTPSSRRCVAKACLLWGAPHKRHTYASELLNAGMRLECLQVLLGHQDIEMTRRYARLTDNTRKNEYFKAMEIIEKGEIDGHYRFDN
jgi:integrase